MAIRMGFFDEIDLDSIPTAQRTGVDMHVSEYASLQSASE